MRRAGSIARLLGSTQIEACLIAVVATIVFAAVILQTKHDRLYSQWFLYHTTWFMALRILAAASILCAMTARLPWKCNHIGLFFSRAGLVLLLIGSLITSWRGFEGQIVLAEGASTDQLSLEGRRQITASWADRPGAPPYVFTFESGPIDWSPTTQLDIGTIDGMSARVLKYYQHGQATESWGADETRTGGPLVRFSLQGPGESSVAHILSDQDFGAELFVGPIALRLQRATSDAMLADFLQTANAELPEKGLLTIYYQGDVKHAVVDEHIGKSITLGDTGANVELVQYFANAKLDNTGTFKPIGEEPKNPLVEMRVHVPNEEKPFRQVAFAKSPLLNFDGVYDRVCPVKFVYEHPKINSTSAIELMQATDGKLYARTTASGNRESNGEVTTGSRLDIPGGFTFVVAEYLPHARREISFKPTVETMVEGRTMEPAIEVEILAAGETNKVWLQRSHYEVQRQVIETPDGSLAVHFGNAKQPLGFSLQLVDCYGDSASASERSCACAVRVVSAQADIECERQITREKPLVHQGVTIYPLSTQEAGHGKMSTLFRVVYAPGRPLKQLGSWSLFVGVAIALSMRSYVSKCLAEGQLDPEQ